jgi:hypothetical protein
VDGVRSGNVYNKYVKSGDFFTIPVTGINKSKTLKITGSPAVDSIEYNYYYI